MAPRIPSRLSTHVMIICNGPRFRPFWEPRTPAICRSFHVSSRCLALKTQKLTDIGEGISEIQIIQWFVSEGAHVEEWSPLLEVQSDKAADTITSRFAGVIKKLHAKQDDTVKTGSALCDIDVQEEESEAKVEGQNDTDITASPTREARVVQESPEPASSIPPATTKPSKHATLATPAVRGLLKEHELDIRDIKGTGKDGRVLKEDVYNHISLNETPRPSSIQSSSERAETPQPLTPLQQAMFRSMTASVQIPHFLYADDVNITSLSNLRKTLNADTNPASPNRLTYLPFIIKTLSLALQRFPILNSRLDLTTNPGKPQIIHRSNHNIGVAVDTPSGLVVPVIKSVQTLTVPQIAGEIIRLTTLAREGKLTTQDLSGGTITVSNIGSLGGGTVLAPVIVDGQVAILGIGKVRAIPVFDKNDNVVKAEMMTLSWSGDHRIVDGATVARAAGVVKGLLEEPGRMIKEMR